MNDTYYAVLGLEKCSSIQEIKAAYRTLAMQWHPDRNKSPDAQQTFIRIQIAYDFLKDAERRREYDVHLRQNVASAAYRPENVGSSWQESMKNRAENYASMPYEKFASILSKEIKLHVSYIPNILAMLITGMFATMPFWVGINEFLSLGTTAIVFMGIFCGLFLWLTIRLYKVMMYDYGIDRKNIR